MRWGSHFFTMAIVLGVATLFYSALCCGMARLFSNDNAVNAVAEDVRPLSLHAVESPSRGYIAFEPDKQVRYGSCDEFRGLNPECCKLASHDRFWVGFRHQLLAGAANINRINYMAGSTNDAGDVLQMESVA